MYLKTDWFMKMSWQYLKLNKKLHETIPDVNVDGNWNISLLKIEYFSF